MTVVIAGGGIAGLATAHALRAAGLGSRILVVEPLTTARKPPRVVALWSNTLAALDKLGLKSQVCPLRTQPEIVGGAKYMAGAGYRTKDGRWLVQPSKPLLPGGDPSVLFMTEDALLSVLRAPLPSLGIETRHASVVGLAAAESNLEEGAAEKTAIVDAGKVGDSSLSASGNRRRSYPDLDNAPRVQVSLSDGTFVTADVVIGADGLDSAVRTLTQESTNTDCSAGSAGGGPFASLQPLRRGYEVYRGIAPLLLPPAHHGGSSNVSSSSIFSTADSEPASFQSWGVGCRFAAIPLAGGYAAWFATLARPKQAQWPASFNSSVKVPGLHDEDRKASGSNGRSHSHRNERASPPGEGRRNAEDSGGASFDGGDSHGDAAIGEAVREHLKGAFEGWHAPVASLLEATPAEGFIWEDARALDARAASAAATTASSSSGRHGDVAESSDAWTQRVLLVGDAAHACDPVLAQGTGIAIEDGLEIASLLANELDTTSTGTTSSSQESKLALPQWSASSIAAVRKVFQAQRLGRLRVVELASDLSQVLGHGGLGVEFKGPPLQRDEVSTGDRDASAAVKSNGDASASLTSSSTSSSSPPPPSLQSPTPSRAAVAFCAGRDALIGLVPSAIKSRVFDASLKWSLGTSSSPMALLFNNRPWAPPMSVDADKNKRLCGFKSGLKSK